MIPALANDLIPSTENTTVFWNLSNHPHAETWPMGQIEAARSWGGRKPNRLADVAFPQVDPGSDTGAVEALAELTLARLLERGAMVGEPVLVMGEFTLVLSLVPRLQAAGLVPVVATSRREASLSVHSNGEVLKEHRFRFVQFRPYQVP